MSALLEVKNLQTYFDTDGGVAKAVDGVSYEVNKGETLGLVGESGCGKSVSALSIMQLIPEPPGKIVGGEVWFKGRNLLTLEEKAMRSVRGNEIAMIFQEPMTSLNPVFTCGNQIEEAIFQHQKLGGKEAKARALEMLRRVGIPAPEQRYAEYPHQLSGGMRQRVMIAMALSCNPSLLIADEPTTALDVTVQAQILELMMRLQDEMGMAVILITHDLGVIAEVADRVAVMYAGKVVEQAPMRELFHNPKHPYTIGLLNSIPRLAQNTERLQAIEGMVPPATHYPKGCRFSTRCKFADAQCVEKEPLLESIAERHAVACWHVDKVMANV
jgi:oligopeptide/dipeptide ABC transporter ATP-binding protein